MQIKKFSAKKIHGYLDFNILFYKDLTFLTGINGCGKTSVVYAIISLISPSLRTLANMDYQEMKLDIKIDGVNTNIWTTRNDDNITIGTSTSEENLIIPVFPKDIDDTRSHAVEKEIMYYEEFESRNIQHPVLQIIKNLPTPMFLDLDRRSSTHSDSSERYYYSSTRIRRSRNIFGRSLTQSLVRAASLAEENYGEFLKKERDLSERLRRDIVLDAFWVELPSGPGIPLHPPTPADIKSLDEMKNTIQDIPQIINVEKEDVDKTLGRTLAILDKILAQIPVGISTDDVISGGDSKIVQSLVRWAINKPQIDRIKKLVQRFSDYKNKHEKTAKPITDYADLINSFLRDSGKEIGFSPTGNLVVQIQGEEPRPISSLSSGEAQVVVIITHLAFNPSAQHANVFIIDEPELSLHVQWQELFVDTLKTANPDVQLILATHSPSIIVERVNRCRDLSKKPKTKPRPKK